MPIISIVVPVYKTEQYLRRCVDSIISQTYTDWELILVDDGSPDRSGAICDEYANNDPRIRVIHKPNAGVSAARNTGIEQIRGSWLMFCDSDDYISSDYLENLITPAGDADLVVSGYMLIFSEEKQYTVNKFTLASFDRTTAGQILQTTLNTSSFGGPCCKLYKSSIIKENHLFFDEKMKFREDTVFVLSYLCYVERIVTIPQHGYMYINTNTTLSKAFHYAMPCDSAIYSIDTINDKYKEVSNRFNFKCPSFESSAIVQFSLKVMLYYAKHNKFSFKGYDTYRQFMQRYPLANSFEGIMRWLIKHRHYKLLFLINCWVLPITLRYRY